jgi:hypothetical protein
MSTKIKLALAAALILGTASAALAGDSSSEDLGGFVMPGSMDGVNPAYHPGIFRNAATTKSYGFVDTSHGWTVAPTQASPRSNQ